MKSDYLKTEMRPQPIFEIFFTNEKIFQGNYDYILHVHLLSVFIVDQLNFKICNVTFCFSKVVSWVKTISVIYKSYNKALTISII